MLLISLGVTEVALWGYRQEAQAARRSGYLDGVLGTARVVSEGDTPTGAVIDVVARQITDVLGADSCRFVAGPVHDARIAVLDHDGVLTRNGHPVDVERGGLPTDQYCRSGRPGGRSFPRHCDEPGHLPEPRAASRRGPAS